MTRRAKAPQLSTPQRFTGFTRKPVFEPRPSVKVAVCALSTHGRGRRPMVSDRNRVNSGERPPGQAGSAQQRDAVRARAAAGAADAVVWSTRKVALQRVPSDGCSHPRWA